ncbi:hypothetical protein MKW98_012310 [Papaver atlanticum]|uniref:Uncharacterized protein n=1 Tax=Papaver atlanticum TaxID=357466 RepID=A0AAD4T219_9MAGN|nr:hypothetical protein MKW98_012310 [Papaver atlanticum]
MLHCSIVVKFTVKKLRSFMDLEHNIMNNFRHCSCCIWHGCVYFLSNCLFDLSLKFHKDITTLLTVFEVAWDNMPGESTILMNSRRVYTDTPFALKT